VQPFDITDGTTPDTLPQWDSLAHMMMIVELEREYGVSVAPVDALELRTVAAVKAMLRTHGVSW
jgi:acyl carrier protein